MWAISFCNVGHFPSLLSAISCLLNSHYESYGTSCPATCSPCTPTRAQMCLFSPGFILDGDTCVSLSHCGWSYEGNRCSSNAPSGLMKNALNSLFVTSHPQETRTVYNCIYWPPHIHVWSPVTVIGMASSSAAHWACADRVQALM